MIPARSSVPVPRSLLGATSALALAALTLALAAGCGKPSSGGGSPPAPSAAGAPGAASAVGTAPAKASTASPPGVASLPPPPALPELPAGLPAAPPSPTPLTAELVALGELLFSDAQLAADHQTACASCHVPTTGYSGGRQPTALQRPNLRRASPLINAAWQREYGWDGRFASLEAHLRAHLHGQLGADVETALAAALQDPMVQASFARAWPHRAEAAPAPVPASPPTPASAPVPAPASAPGPTGDDAIAALAAFVRTRYAGGSRWDLEERSGHPAADLKAGYALFVGKAQCSVCHPPPLYTDLGYHRLGLISVADEGRGLVDPELRGAFKTPSLRGAALRPRFFHDASATTLAAAVDWHLAGGVGQGADRSIIDPALPPIALTRAERDQLLAFLAALSEPAR